MCGLVTDCCIIESYNMFCWYVFTVTCFPDFFGKHEAVHPRNASEFPEIHLEIVAFYDTTTIEKHRSRLQDVGEPLTPRRPKSQSAPRPGSKDSTMTRWGKNATPPGPQKVGFWKGSPIISRKSRFVKYHSLAKLFLLHKEMFWMIWIPWSWCSLFPIEWRVNVGFLVESWYISWFKKLSLFICGYILYLLRNYWKFLGRQFDL